ncbi:MAG: helicase [Planctomyces sp.]|nr:helicase [Planctomyces sp.]
MSSSPPGSLTRDQILERYYDTLSYTPYAVQEEALFAWFTSETGVLVCAPTGTGKTLIAEGAIFEALQNQKTVYYTTPLIALTDQKFAEIQEAAERWGFSRDDVGLITGNRKVNPDAKVLVVVAEILLNRLLHPDAFDFANVFAVVMDEFHSFSDPERGIVWEFSLSLLPDHVRLMLLSATIGNANPFVTWLHRCHGRRLELVVGTERKVPLTFQWIGDQFVTEHLEYMAQGEGEGRRTPALVFCFDRELCWSTAEELKGRSILQGDQQKQIAARLKDADFKHGVGPKLKQLLHRGVGVHHAGLLPKHRRLVEELFQEKLLSICVCTETLSAGINLPARAVVMTCLLKGPPGKKKLIDASLAHQIFGRAGRPQFDKEGYVYALPHEDDVRHARWKEKYDQIPEDTKDPGLIKAKKALKKKMPTRNPGRQYWNEAQFEKLKTAPPRDLVSQGEFPLRLVAYLVKLSPDVDRIRTLVRKRLMEPGNLAACERDFDQLLVDLHHAGFVELDPPPPAPPSLPTPEELAAKAEEATETPEPATEKPSWLSQHLQKSIDEKRVAQGKASATQLKQEDEAEKIVYRPKLATPTALLERMFAFRSINPLYGVFLADQFEKADRLEWILALESVLEFPRSLVRSVRIPPPKFLPPGTLANEVLDPEIIARGILPAGDLYPEFDPTVPPEQRKYAPTLPEKLLMLFQSEYPGVSIPMTPVFVVADLEAFGFNFYKLIGGRDLAKQEGLVFKHLLRMVLLLEEFAECTPPGRDPQLWRSELLDLAAKISWSCEAVDPQSTEQTLKTNATRDLLQGETADVPELPQIELPPRPPGFGEADPDGSEVAAPLAGDDFGAGLDENAEDVSSSEEAAL